jgi:DNA polymerase III delta subunit
MNFEKYKHHCKILWMARQSPTLEEYKNLFKRLKDPASIKKGYIFWGSETYLMDTAVDQICATLSAEKDIVDGSAKDFAGELGLHLQGGLFQKSKVLVVKFVDREEKVLRYLELLLRAGEHFVIILKEWKAKPAIHKDIEVINFRPLDRQSYGEWLEDKIKKMGKQVNSPTLIRRMVELMPEDLRSAFYEIQKLELYSMDRQFLTSEDLQIISDYETARVWEVLHDVLSGESGFFSKFLCVFEESEPTYLTSSLINHFIREYKLGARGLKFSQADLLRMLLLTVRFDAQLKSSSVDKKLLMMQMLMNIKVNVD